MTYMNILELCEYMSCLIHRAALFIRRISVLLLFLLKYLYLSLGSDIPGTLILPFMTLKKMYRYTHKYVRICVCVENVSTRNSKLSDNDKIFQSHAACAGHQEKIKYIHNNGNSPRVIHILHHQKISLWELTQIGKNFLKTMDCQPKHAT